MTREDVKSIIDATQWCYDEEESEYAAEYLSNYVDELDDEYIAEFEDPDDVVTCLSCVLADIEEGYPDGSDPDWDGPEDTMQEWINDGWD